MVLKRHDNGEPVKELQRRLNRLGSLLLVDGDFGASTELGVVDARVRLALNGPPEADDALLAALAQVPEPSPELTAPGVTFIAREEVSSPAEYRRRYIHPELPPPPSGITIGIGYDLQFSSPAELNADWGEVLPPAVIAKLAVACEKVGRQDLLARVADVEVPLLAAVRVFLAHSMPKYIKSTRGIYPTLDQLPPARRSALVSLVYNRGNSLGLDPSKPKQVEDRREMRTIRDLLAAGDLEPIAEQLESMTRLWDAAQSPGLIARRQREATLWRSGFETLQLA